MSIRRLLIVLALVVSSLVALACEGDLPWQMPNTEYCRPGQGCVDAGTTSSTSSSGDSGNDASTGSDATTSETGTDAATCTPTDGIKNCGETDIDCGGPSAPKCAGNKACSQPSDCASNQCTANLCVPKLAQSSYIKASNTDIGDGFGASMSLSADGKTLVVGAPFESSNAAANQGDNSVNASGAVYVYALSGASWVQQAFLKASNITEGALFGTAVSVSADGNTLVVGASFAADPSFLQHGSAYVFTRTGTTWSQPVKLDASDADKEDLFGAAVALSDDGSTVAIGGRSASLGKEAVYVFKRTGAAFAQEAIVIGQNTKKSDSFGASLAISADGNTLAVGAPNESSNATNVNGDGSNNGANGSGAAYVFSRAGSTWTQQSYVKAFNTGALDAFGTSVALSANGNTLVVGAPYEDSNAKGVGGNQADESAFGAGAVYSYTRTGTTWTSQSYIKASNTTSDQEFGSSVALSASGAMLVVGAPPEASNAKGVNGNQADTSAFGAGAAYTFTLTGGVFTPGDYVKASNTRSGASFGRVLCIDATGATMVSTSPDESSNAKGIGGNQADESAFGSGATYVFSK